MKMSPFPNENEQYSNPLKSVGLLTLISVGVGLSFFISKKKGTPKFRFQMVFPNCTFPDICLGLLPSLSVAITYVVVWSIISVPFPTIFVQPSYIYVHFVLQIHWFSFLYWGCLDIFLESLLGCPLCLDWHYLRQKCVQWSMVYTKQIQSEPLEWTICEKKNIKWDVRSLWLPITVARISLLVWLFHS